MPLLNNNYNNNTQNSCYSESICSDDLYNQIKSEYYQFNPIYK